MANERKLTVVLAGDSKGLDRALGNATRSIGGFGGKLGGLAKAGGLAFAAMGAGAVVMGKGLVDAAIESQKVTKQTDAVLKSMGDQAGVTAGQVADLAAKLSLQSGVDDEVIQSAQNVLLTFGKVRNEVGKGNDIFNRASQAALDMSVALGTDMQGASIQVGKALNDPIKGVTALGRAGVSFTKDQKEAIKALVESGDTLGAQKIILSELDNQFAGSAKAQATAGDKLKVAWGNVQEELGAKLLPMVEKAASFLADKLPGAMKTAEKIIGPVAKNIGMFFNALTSGFTEDEGTPIEMFALKVRAALQDVVAFVQAWWPKVVAGFQQVISFVQQNWPTIQKIVQQVVQAVVGFVQERWPAIRDTITQAMTTVQSVISGVVSVVMTLWNNFGNNILSFVQRVWPNILQVISGAMKAIQGVIKVITSLIKGDWSGVWNGIKSIFSGVWQAIQGIVKGAMEGLRLVIGAALEVIGSVVKRGLDGVVGFFTGLPGRLGGLAKTLASTGLTLGSKLLGGLLNGLKGMGDAVKGFAGDVLDAVAGIGKGLLNGVIDALNDLLPDRIGKIKVAGRTIFGGLDLPNNPIPRLAGGGIVKARPGGILANIGEGRYDEAVIPLDGRRGLMPAFNPVPVVIELDGQVLGRAMIRFDADHRAANGRGAFVG